MLRPGGPRSDPARSERRRRRGGDAPRLLRPRPRGARDAGHRARGRSAPRPRPGPLLSTSTTRPPWCRPGCAARLDDHGNIVITTGGRHAHEPPAISAIPISLELVKNALDAIVDEMAIALVRTAYSNNLKNAMDMSCALCDAEGRLIAQGLTLPLHLGLHPRRDGARAAQVRRPSLDPGDVFILNDPFEGGTHLPDFYIFKPIFVGAAPRRLVREHRAPARRGRQDRRAATAATRPRSSRRACASRRSGSTRAGEPVEAVFELIDRNVRVPRQVLGDVRSQVAACLTGERGYLAAGRAARRRALRRVHRRAPRPGRAAGAQRHHGDARRHLRVHRLDRRRRHRPRSRSRSRWPSRSRATA